MPVCAKLFTAALLPALLLFAAAAVPAAGGDTSTLDDGNVGTLQEARQAAPSTLPECQQQLAAVSGKFKTCNTQKTTCTKQLTAARSDASKAAANATTLAAQLKTEKASSSRLSRDLTQCRANITSCDSQLRQAQLTIAQCATEWQGFAAGNATLAASRLATIQRMAALQRAAEERIASLEQQLNSTKAQLSNMQAEANEARADLDATIEDMKALQADLDAARQEGEDMQDAWYTFNGTVVAELNRNLTSCTNERSALAFNASSCAASLDIAQAGCEGMAEQLQEAQVANVTCAGALFLCQSTVADLTWQTAGCDNRIAAVVADRDKYKEELDAAVERLANCTTSTVGTDNDVITLRAQNQALTYELTDCQDQLSQKEQDYVDLLIACASG